MNFKKSFLFLSAFIVITIIVLVVEKPFKEPTTRSEQDIQKLFPSLDIDQVDEVIINQIPEQTFKLQKTDKGWVVANQDNFPVNPNDMKELLKRSAEFDDSSLISRNPDNQGTFQVNMIGIEVQLLSPTDNVLAHFFVGKNGPDYTSTYVRADGSDNVYLQKGYLKSIFDKARSKWRDARVLTFEKDNVDSVTLHFVKEKEGKKPEEHEVTIQSALDTDKVVWNLTQPEQYPAKTSELTRIINSLATFTADDFAQDKTMLDAGLEDPVHWFKVTMKDGMSYTLKVGAKENGKYFVNNVASDYIFIVAEYKVINLKKTFDDLKDEEKKKAEEAALKAAAIASTPEQAAETAPSDAKQEKTPENKLPKEGE